MPTLHTAKLRFATFYFHELETANRLYGMGKESALDGLKRFDLEWGNIQAAQAWVADQAESQDDFVTLCNRFPDAGAGLLSIRLHPKDRIRWLDASLSSALRLKDRSSEAVHLGNLGMAYSDMALVEEALDYHAKAMSIDQELGNINGEATNLNNLGIIYQYLGQYEKAYSCFEQARELFVRSVDKKGEGVVLIGFASVDINRGPNLEKRG